MKVHCGAGRICEVDGNGEPQCICIPECPVEIEPRRKACSNHNETWSSDCAIYQQRCLCNKGDERCKGEEYKHVHIEYYGECREMPVRNLKSEFIFAQNFFYNINTLSFHNLHVLM